MVQNTVILKRTQQSKAFRNGNQLVFTRAVLKSPSHLCAGDLVHLTVQGDSASSSSSKQQQLPDVPIGWGVYNPNSLYKIRMLNHRFLQPDLYRAVCETVAAASAASTATAAAGSSNESEEAVVTAAAANVLGMKVLLRHRVTAAVHLRRQVLGLPRIDVTDTYRLIHGEGDGLSGLAVDVIGRHTLVVVSSAAWCERYRNLIESVLLEVINRAQGGVEETFTVVWKTAPARLAQDGIVATATTTVAVKNGPDTTPDLAAKTDVDDNGATDGAAEDEDEENTSILNDESIVDTSKMVVSMENGIAYETYPYATGQKTGVYSDQRENRWDLAHYCQEKRVLDLCCFTGGFSLNAAIHGGAKHCTGIDSSPIAIAACHANAIRNDVTDLVTFVPSDITTYLQACKEQYDVVVLDPPKLAPSAKLLDKARRKYHALNRDALSVVDATKGGLLFTCTCSAAMTQSEGGQDFLKMVQAAALAAGRQVTLLKVNGAAPCHTQSPMSYPASAYLTAALFYVHPKA